MTKGFWIVIGFLMLQGLFYWLYESNFLERNVWQRGDIQNADEITRKTDFLALGVVKYVSRSVSAVVTGLVVVFVYLVVRLRRSERRIAELERVLTTQQHQQSGTS